LTAIAIKFRDFFSDLWLDLQLMLSKKPEIRVENPEPARATQTENMSGIMPVKAAGSSKATGMSQLMDLRTKKAQEKKERIKNARFSFGLRHLKLSKKGRLAFYDQMATLVGSGVPLIDSLSLIQAQERNKNIKKLYAEMIHEINGGLSLAESMELFPYIFPRMQSALVEAAEASGNLKEVLVELVEEMEASQDFLKKVTNPEQVQPVLQKADYGGP